jgi:hypothetical protein
MRSLGMSIGIAAAASILSWQLQVLTGGGRTTVGVAAIDLLAATRVVVLFFAGICVVAAVLSLVRAQRR